jgi:hypothetical protein
MSAKTKTELEVEEHKRKEEEEEQEYRQKTCCQRCLTFRWFEGAHFSFYVAITLMLSLFIVSNVVVAPDERVDAGGDFDNKADLVLTSIGALNPNPDDYIDVNFQWRSLVHVVGSKKGGLDEWGQVVLVSCG